jgi:desulfoferrodoxin (superoxide reductase-like protein)
MPEFDDLAKMDNDEKIYLNKLLEKADLKGRLSVPTPSKDQEEKDIHEFEVMKGQIMSGNDSKEFVKKFKLLMRKLAHKQLLPRNEVRDMIEILEDLGY